MNTEYNMLLLSRSDIESLLTIEDTIQVVEEGFRLLTKGQVVMPQRVATPIEPSDAVHLSMPAFIEGDPGALSVKIVSVYPCNPSEHGLPMIQGVLLLHDASTGRLLAMMDAEHITAMRTGAASGVATKYLAREESHVLTLFGTGAQAAAQAQAVCAVRPVERVNVLSRTGAKDEVFTRKLQAKLDVEVRATRDARVAVAESDIVCTATNSVEPVFDGGWLRTGTHINAVGAYKRNMRELDATTILRSRIFVDRHEAAQAEAGDILLAIVESSAAEPLTYDHVVGELGDVVLRTVAGRNDASDITLFKSVGLAMQDAVTAAHVYTLAKASGAGKVVDLMG